MTTPVYRIPIGSSDDLDRALHREKAWPETAAERVTCAEHSDWHAKCAHLPHRQVA